MIPIRDRGLERECEITTVRSSGPGGQNVNKVSTKAELAFHIKASQLLTEEEKEILTAKLASKINDEGYLKISDSTSRSQAANKENAVGKLYITIEKALIKPKRRKATQVPKAVKEKIIKEKKAIGEKKSNRRVSRNDWAH